MSILDVAAEEAQRLGVERVFSIHLKLGPLAGVVKEALLSAYELAREGSSLQETSLLIEDVPIRVNCPTCREARPVVSMQELCCAECGTPAAEVVSGRELEIVALEVP
jgi:hydrogenase nickel incorporation protein HypA/HybF